MKAGDSATAISKHNYISYGLPSLDDLKRLRALPFSRLVERESSDILDKDLREQSGEHLTNCATKNVVVPFPRSCY